MSKEAKPMNAADKRAAAKFEAGKAKRSNMRKNRPERNVQGKIVKAAPLLEWKAEKAVVRVQPDRRWFGNTRVIGQADLEKFRERAVQARTDPYTVLLRQHKLPMSLVNGIAGLTGTDGKTHQNAMEPYQQTFGGKAQRRRPKMAESTLEELMARVENGANAASSTKQHISTPQDEQMASPVQAPLEACYLKGQSKRIWAELHKVIDSSDVLVHVLDARDPLGTRCEAVETFIKKEHPHKHVVLLLNKVDLVPPRVTEHWLKYLGRECPTVAFRASLTNAYGKGTLIALLRQFARLHCAPGKDKDGTGAPTGGKKQISVGFIGYPNVGKSSVINALRAKRVCAVAPIPGQTRVWQYVTLMKRVLLIDCPGVVPISSLAAGSSTRDEDAELLAVDTITVLRGVVRVDNLAQPQDHVPAVLARVKPAHLERTYGREIAAPVTGATEPITNWSVVADEFLQRLAIKCGKLRKGGDPDISIAARMVLNDWLRGKLPYFVPPPTYQVVNSDEVEELPEEAEGTVENAQDQIAEDDNVEDSEDDEDVKDS